MLYSFYYKNKKIYEKNQHFIEYSFYITFLVQNIILQLRR